MLEQYIGVCFVVTLKNTPTYHNIPSTAYLSVPPSKLRKGMW